MISILFPIDVTLEVAEGHNKPPSFVDGPGSEIELQEGYTKFSQPVAKYTAQSNIPMDNTCFFHLVSGRTEKTNKGKYICFFKAVEGLCTRSAMY